MSLAWGCTPCHQGPHAAGSPGLSVVRFLAFVATGASGANVWRWRKLFPCFPHSLWLWNSEAIRPHQGVQSAGCQWHGGFGVRPSTLPIPMASYAGVSRVRWNRPLHGALAITCCRSLPIRRNEPNQGTLALTLPRGSRRQGGGKKFKKK